MQKEFYSSKEEFMRKQFPETFKTPSTEKIFIQTEKIQYTNSCLHEHCIIDNHLSIGKGKLTLVYRCLDCGECVLDCRSILDGMIILTLASTISKNTTINYQKVLKKK